MSKVNEEIDYYSGKMKDVGSMPQPLGANPERVRCRRPNGFRTTSRKLLTKEEMEQATAHLKDVSDRLAEDTR